MAAGDAYAHAASNHKHQPSLHSPTLTNPELVLPNEVALSIASTPPRLERPPSPTYLYQQREEHDEALLDRSSRIAQIKGLGITTKRKSFRRSTSIESELPGTNSSTKSAPMSRTLSPEVALGSSPTIFPERSSSRNYLTTPQVSRKPSNASSSMSSIDFENLPRYRFDGQESDIGTSDGESAGTITPTRDHSPSWSRDAQGTAMQRADRSSQELSRRAEMILANAKKRLNLMDQNLRGARALTAENLQRAASMQVHHAPYRDRFLVNGDSTDDTLTSDPLINGYGHARGRSDAVLMNIPHRAATAMAREALPTTELGERSVIESAAWTANTLRGTRSQELPRMSSRALGPISPEPQLGTLLEHDQADTLERDSKRESSSSPATTELHQQMHQLRSRISFLREKTREDSLRRQSLLSVRAPNPFTDAQRKENATKEPTPEVVSRWSVDSSVKRMSIIPRGQPSPEIDIPEEDETLSQVAESPIEDQPEIDWRPVGHVREVSRTSTIPVHEGDVDVASIKGLIMEGSPNPMGAGSSLGDETDYQETSAKGPTLAHEDRADAFDYHNFFLHSTMGRLGANSDSASDASDDTARGPKLDPESFPMLGTPRTPEMLRKIEQGLHHRQISRLSVATEDSLASFATATEGLKSGRTSPEKRANGSDGADSGVALQDRPIHKRQLSHQIVAQLRTIDADPSSVALHAVTDSGQSAIGQSSIGLKDKALVFMVVDSMRSICVKLRDDKLSADQGRVLRRRLEEARKVLDGQSPVVS